ncbi:hypothetical protein N425_09605 [Tannerella sp. oral taxon BU063 isolate Cell 2]|uniref:Uncharacterized protein n=1 Tax=Tannerella sp. oral taxon BU063 isolate Cell 2 TaxID=1411148 RepID=W2C4U4_9BACT|nr:hypothetical protein N425_09605 [Tannerella sp. oral taxon BU063 isolate Cell 2]
MSHGQAPETLRTGPAAFYFVSVRLCEDLAEVCFVAKLTGKGPADCHFVPDLPRAGLMEYVWRFSELPEYILLMDISARNFPEKYYS